MIGFVFGVFENVVCYVWNDCKQFGFFVGEFQGMQYQIVQFYIEIVVVCVLVYNVVCKKEVGEDFVKDVVMVKLYVLQVVGCVFGLVVEWMGGMGFVCEGFVEKFWCDSKIGVIYEGISNIQ